MKKFALLLLLLPLFVAAKTDHTAKADNISADAVLLKAHVYTLTDTTKGFRCMQDTVILNKAANYILADMRKYSSSVYTQPYMVQNKVYGNIISSFGPKDAPRIIIGAHYDVCEDQPGADDNASGVAGLLELNRLLSQEDARKWKYRIDLVAYTLEEPPTFRTPAMGSAVHAKSLADSGIRVKGMVSIEMIGYYKDEKHTQQYPAGIFKLFYGSRGNFITVVRRFKGGQFTRQFSHRFKHGDNIITKVFKGPKWIPGIDFSDHLNYWAEGWEALMITDTAFERNKNYHEKTDTPDKLDYTRMSYVVNNMFKALTSMAK